MVKGLEHLSQEEEPRGLGLLKKALADQTSMLKYLLGGSKDEGATDSALDRRQWAQGKSQISI